MRLTSYSDYPFLSFIYFSFNSTTNEIVNIADIADSYRISKNHLTKVIHQLGKLGYIDTVRGKNGGIRLSMHPKQINIGQLFRHTESDFALVQCFEEIKDKNKDTTLIPAVNFSTTSTSYCAIAPACTLKSAIAEAAEAFMAVLDRYTLDDIMKNKDELYELLTHKENGAR